MKVKTKVELIKCKSNTSTMLRNKLINLLSIPIYNGYGSHSNQLSRKINLKN